MENRILNEVKEFVSYLHEKSLASGDEGIPMNYTFYAPIIIIIWQLVASTRFQYDDPLLNKMLKLMIKFNESLSNLIALASCPQLRYIMPEATRYNTLTEFRDLFSSYMIVSLSIIYYINIFILEQHRCTICETIYLF